MSGNPLPWIVIAGIVLVALYLKGYFRLPVSAKQSSPALTPGPVNLTADTPSRTSGIDVDNLAKLGSYTLGLAFAKAVRAEAESTVAGQFARDAGEALHAKFTAPFSAPAPAGPVPAGPAPSQ